MEYKNTIITPKTDFPMKAGLPAREPSMLKRWEEQGLYNAMLEKNKDLPRFVLHDGPPISNGYIHMGHAQLSRGFSCSAKFIQILCGTMKKFAFHDRYLRA